MSSEEPMQPGARFDTLFSSLVDAAVLIDPETGRFTRVNASAQALLGYSAEDFSRMGPADIHPHEIPRLDAFLGRIRDEGRWTADDLSCMTRSGALIPALVSAYMVREPDGAERILALIRDRRETHLAELGEAVRRLTHDLKNTLATAQLMCDRLAAHPDQRVRVSAESMMRALERAVTLSREASETGRATARAPDRERFLLDDVMDELQATVAGVGLEEQTLEDAGSGPVMLDADFDQVYRILLNLVRNAFNAGADRVTVAGARRDPGRAVLTVRDNGPGLPEEIRARIEAGARPGPGSGLGLTIARELARNHGGDVILEATGPEGTCLAVVLPDEGG